VNYATHPAANVFPMIELARLNELAADIKAHGLHEPIKLLHGQIIDGRNRFAACEIAEAKPVFIEMPDTINPWEYVWSLNGERRDLNSGQRYGAWEQAVAGSKEWLAAIAKAEEEANSTRAKAAKERERNADGTLKPTSGGTDCSTTGSKEPKKDAAEPPKEHKTRKAKAESAGVDAGTVQRMDYLKTHRPDLYQRVIDEGDKFTAYKAHSEAKKDERKAEIEAQKAAIESGEAELPEGQYEVVVMDPPWNYGREYDPNGSRVANPYPEMTQAELLAMEPPFTDDSVLFLWTTHKFIWDAKELLGHWGFTYKATMVWDKERMGTGATLRMQCEFCLVAFKGKPTWVNTTWRDIIRETRREHSRKPDAFYQLAEECTVGRRLDMFSRAQRPGWGQYGNDKGKFS